MNQNRFENVIPGTLVKTYPVFPLLAEPVEGNDRATALYEDTFERDLMLNADCTESELSDYYRALSHLYPIVNNGTPPPGDVEPGNNMLHQLFISGNIYAKNYLHFIW